MKRPFEVKCIDLSTAGVRVVVLNRNDAKDMDLKAMDRVALTRDGGEPVSCIVDLTDTFVSPGIIGLFREVYDTSGISDHDKIFIEPMGKPDSIRYIKQKMAGNRHTPVEIQAIIDDLMKEELSDVELTAWISSVYIRGLDKEETIALTHSIVESGTSLDLHEKRVFDKHCLAYDTPTIVRRNDIVKIDKIGKMCDSMFDNSANIIKDGTAEFTESEKLEALTFDENGKMTFAPVRGVHRYPSPKMLVNVKLLGNREIALTEDHTVFMLKDGRTINRAAAQLKPGDYVIVPRQMPIHQETTNINLTKELGNTEGVYCINSGQLKPISEANPEKTTQIQMTKGRPIKNEIEITPELMRLLGYYVSEGFVNYQGVFFNFGSHEQDLVQDTVHCIQKVFGIEPTINQPHKTATRVCAYNQLLSKVFSEIFDAGKDAASKQIPSIVLNSSQELQKEFLRALINGDGYVRRGYEVIFVTVSEKLAMELRYLLAMLGLTCSTTHAKSGKRVFPTRECRVKKAYYIYTQARELFGGRQKANVSFINLLPLKELGDVDFTRSSERKPQKKQAYITQEKALKMLKCFKNEDVRSIITGDLSVLPVKSTEKIPSTSKFVYDFELDGHHRFFAGSSPIAVHNCIGGVAGNRTTMLVVPIIAAAGLTIPKTSSRAITSPAGTADTMEVLAPVNLNKDDIEEVVNKNGGCIVWGGAVNLAAADDKLIRLRHPLSLDPRGMLLASIMAKKKAVGATDVIIDIPVGEGAKIKTTNEATVLAKQFNALGASLEMNIHSLVTNGDHPIGLAVGPTIEARETLRILENEKVSPELVEKSAQLAGVLMEIGGKAETGKGRDLAIELIKSGKANQKFREIIEAQGGDGAIKIDDIPMGEYEETVTADREGRIEYIDNKGISSVVRNAGAPADKVAGMYLHVEEGDRIKKGQPLFTVYAKSERKIDQALEAYEKRRPIQFAKIILRTLD